ncbi:hypothetical protein, partial [Klebsiella pneumoniae]|uniref:hypothetical protein n=1 Tax=Klebsiella pneumoniae TaxID=573 RepID=UPI001F4B00CC
ARLSVAQAGVCPGAAIRALPGLHNPRRSVARLSVGKPGDVPAAALRALPALAQGANLIMQ